MKKYLILLVGIILMISVGVVILKNNASKPKQTKPDKTNQQSTSSQFAPKGPVIVDIKTPKGIITVEIRPDLTPITSANFLKLVDSKFYDGLTFHRVEDWVVQGGDPKGDGTGGPGWQIPLETNPQLKNVRGAIAMARSQDPNSAGSQFYILKKDATWLDGQYAVFGKVLSGMEIVDQLAIGDSMEIHRK